ncbi:MAG: glycosyltransferase family 2 protein [Candidatus Omnitrophica bacterium]|nr:glycosyltransferase family 2 protein [Candidatus Omnitrophota bacterium]
MKISMIVLTKNESSRIKECLESMHGWADEIIIVDDESTDDTCQIASNYTDKIFKRKMNLEGQQRNFGASKASNDWVMMIDSDERMTSELQQEIEERLADSDEKTVAYWVPRRNYIGNYWLRYGGWYPAAHIKVYKKGYLTWREGAHELVHPGIDIKDGYKGTTLTKDLIHYNFKNIEDYISKVNRQTTLDALKWHITGKKISFFRAIWKTFDRFGRRQIRKKGHKDGFYGFVASSLSGLYQFFTYIKFCEIKKYGSYLDIIENKKSISTDA